jgi:hypothetical protein
LLSDNNHGLAFERWVALHLYLALCADRPLKELFDFVGDTPSWAGKTAKVVIRGEGGEVHALKDNQTALTQMGLFGLDWEGCRDWFNVQNDRFAPWLFPNQMAGPDIVMLLRVGEDVSGWGGSYLWVLIQAKTTYVSGDELKKALFSVSPHWLYTNVSGPFLYKYMLTLSPVQDSQTI